MPMNSHLVELERRHQALEKKIEDAITHPGTDDLRMRRALRELALDAGGAREREGLLAHAILGQVTEQG